MKAVLKYHISQTKYRLYFLQISGDFAGKAKTLFVKI